MGIRRVIRKIVTLSLLPAFLGRASLKPSTSELSQAFPLFPKPYKNGRVLDPQVALIPQTLKEPLKRTKSNTFPPKAQTLSLP